MIIAETVTINGKDFTRTISDENRYVVRDGITYTEAYDPTELGRTYTEGDLIEGADESEAMLSVLLGGAE